MTSSSITGWLNNTTVRGNWLVLGGLLIAETVPSAPRDVESVPDMEFFETSSGPEKKKINDRRTQPTSETETVTYSRDDHERIKLRP